MADVTDRDRGQLLLVAALALAVMFVVLALLLNTVIYTENLATRSANAGGDDVLAHRAAAVDGAGGIIRYVNVHNNSDEAELGARFEADLANWTRLAGNQQSLRGRFTDVSNVSITTGTRIAQNDTTRDFSNASGTANWTPATDVSGTRAFRMNVSRSLLDEDDETPFRVVADNGTDTWTMTVAVNDSATDDITVEMDGETCTVEDAPYTAIDLTAGTVGGTDCGPAFVEGLDGDYDISYENATNVNGTYQLVVNDTDAVDASDYNTQPHASDAIYSARIDVTYESDQVYYRTELRVAPGESDD